jgi:hypothetical protein
MTDKKLHLTFGSPENKKIPFFPIKGGNRILNISYICHRDRYIIQQL